MSNKDFEDKVRLAVHGLLVGLHGNWENFSEAARQMKITPEQAGLPVYGTNRRVTSVPHRVAAAALTVGAALGPPKVPALRAALSGRMLSGLITDEATAKALLPG